MFADCLPSSIALEVADEVRVWSGQIDGDDARSVALRSLLRLLGPQWLTKGEIVAAVTQRPEAREVWANRLTITIAVGVASLLVGLIVSSLVNAVGPWDLSFLALPAFRLRSGRSSRYPARRCPSGTRPNDVTR